MSKKYKITLIAAVVIIVFLVGLFLHSNYQYKIELRREEFVYEYGTPISSRVSNYIKNDNSTKNINNYKISSIKLKIRNNKFIEENKNYVSVGEYEVKITYKKVSETFKIKVSDTVPPEFTKYEKEVIVEKGVNKLNLKEYFSATDLSSVELSFEGEYDFNKAGEYNMSAIAKDYHANIAKKDFILKIVSSGQEQNLNSNQDSNNTAKSQVPVNKYNNEGKIESNNYPKYRKDVSDVYIVKINEYRKANGLSELPVTNEVQTEANRRAKELVNLYSHEGVGYGFGENIGEGDIGVDFFEAWRNSPSHNAAMLRTENIAIASSVYEYNNHWYAVVSFKMNY